MKVMEVKFYNSYTNKKEIFKPENKNEVKIYSCGPTVYNYAHIGNFRSFIFSDVLRRSLKLLGYKVNHTMNITDIDDKIINASIEEKISIEEFTSKWTKLFFEDIETLNIEQVEHYPKATDYIDEMTSFIERLKKNNLVYEKEGSIYYSIKAFENYGKLSKIDVTGMKTGARYDSDEYTKDDARDFVLWKQTKQDGEKFWETQFGKGRPGWHLECSAMIRKIYSSGIDIHTGGIDLLFPHHENEIAQTCGAYPHEHFVNLWMHCEHLLVEKQKMSKSLGNFHTLKSLMDKKIKPSSIRFLLLSSHYRTKLNFTFASLEDAEKSVNKIQSTLNRVLEISGYDLNKSKESNQESLNLFLESLADDLNTPKAIGIIFDELKKINQKLDSKNFSENEISEYLFFFQKINELLGFLEFKKKSEEILDEEILSLIEQRANAKKEKNFALSDKIRNELLEKGIILEDSPSGVKWKRK